MIEGLGFWGHIALRLMGRRWMRHFGLVALGAVLLLTPVAPHAQDSQTKAAEDDAAKNARQARAKLDAMVEAMGGQSWLNVKNRYQHGHIAGFYHGVPNPGTLEVFDFHSWPDRDRLEA